MKNKYGIYIPLHIAIIVMWSFFYKLNIITNDAAKINALSMALLACFIGTLYVYIMESQNKANTAGSIEYTVTILFCSSLICKTHALPFGTLFIMFLLYKARVSFMQKIFRRNLIVLIFLFLGFQFYIFQSEILSAFMMLLGMGIDIFNKYKWVNFKQIHILPTSVKKSKYILAIWIPLAVYISYIFNFDTFCLNMIFQVFMILFEMLTVAHIQDSQEAYEEIRSFFFLTKYIHEERENFSRLLHDDIIQDIRAAYNLLALRQPDTVLSRDVLFSLESRVRKMMNFYSSNIFLEYGAYINLENMLNSIQAIYPNKKVQIDIHIDDGAEKYLKKKPNLELVLHISKELINNIFKHSDAAYITYKITLSDNAVLHIDCESDGASISDYENIYQSKGGILLLRVLVEANYGKLAYNYSEGILKSEVELEANP